MAELVALDLPLGPTLVEEVRRAHDRGRAVCVVDQRLSPTRQAEQLELLSPTIIVGPDGESSKRAEGHPVEMGDGLVMLTSGSSGPPKVAVLTWTSVIASAELTASELNRGSTSRWNVCLAPCHIGGFAVVARTIFTDDVAIWGDVRRLEDGPLLGATHIAVVPTQLTRHDLSNYRIVLLGGAKAPENLAANVVTTWGMTETGSGVIYNGRPLLGVGVATVNDELMVRSPTLFRCYRDGSEPFERGPDGREGWFRTGDAVSIENGQVTVHGRLNYVINTGGEKVWPEDLESVLGALDGVTDVAVVGVIDAEWGHRIEAFVVSEVDPNELFARFSLAASEAVGPWAKPKAVRIVSQIPRTDSGKIQRDRVEGLLQLTPPVD